MFNNNKEDVKMNKKVMFSALVSLLISHAALAAGETKPETTPVTVNGGNITFNGSVTSGACAVKSDDTSKIVVLDSVPSRVFDTANKAAKYDKDFTLELVDCDTSTLKSVQVTFGGQSIDGHPNLLKNNAGAGSAQNVGLQIYGPNGAALDLGDLSSKIDLNGSTSIPFTVDYVSTATPVIAGAVRSVANFQLTYN